jgi:DNA/RNA-binding domain of Phe-tRNA-synthetase-like protein
MPDPLVQAMFAAELESTLLTAGHDSGSLRAPLALGVATGAESMPSLGGAEKLPPAGDLVMRDAQGIVASVLLGPDARTSIAPTTASLLFVVYAPPEIAEARLLIHLERLAALSALACPALRAGEPSSMLL